MATPSQAEMLAGLRALIVGLTKHLPTQPLAMMGVPYTGTTLAARLQASVDSLTQVLEARAALEGALQKDRTQREGDAALLATVHEALWIFYGNAPETLNDFGMRPRKTRKPLTPEANLLRAERARATRAARHTMGKRQKAKNKGSV
jgi:hypothetical protein